MTLASLAPSSMLQATLGLGGLDPVVFVRPEALWALAVAAPVLLAHLYRRRRRRLAVVFVPLVREAVGPVHARGAWRRVREAARLLCRIAAVAALALAIAGPKPAQAAAPIEDLVIVIDADETTSAVEADGSPLEGRTRFDRSVSLAKAHVLAHPAGRVGLVVAERSPRTIVAPTDDRGAVLTGLDRPDVDTHAGHADLGAAIDVARQPKSGDRPLRVLLITSRDVPPAVVGPDVIVEGAGVADDDQGVVDASVEASSERTPAVVRVVLHNFGRVDRRRTVTATWSYAGVPPEGAQIGGGLVANPIGTQTLEVPARGDAQARFDVHEAEAVFVDIDLRGAESPVDDAWFGDDLAVVHIAKRRRPSVLVVHGGNPRPFVRALLEAMGDAIDRDASGFVPVGSLATARPRDVTIVDGVAPPAGAVRKGAWIFLAPFGAADGRGGLPFTVGRDVKEPLVWRSEASDPLLRGVDLSTAYVARGTTIVGDGSRALASVEGEAVVAEGEREGARWLAFGLDADGSDLPLRAALPILLANAIRRMGQIPLEPLKPFYRAGEPLVPRTFLGATRVVLEDARPPGVSVSGPDRLSSRGRRFAVQTRREKGPAPGASDPWLPWLPVRPERGTVAWTSSDVAAFGPDLSSPPIAPFGGPFEVGATPTGGSTVFSAINTFDRSFDIRPVRPASPPPPPAPPPPEDEAARWLRWLLIAAGSLLLVDLLLGAVGRRFVASPSGSA